MKLLLVVIVFADLVLSINSVNPNELQNIKHENYEQESSSSSSFEEEVVDVDEVEGRSLRQKKQTLRLTCKTFPRICRFKGSPGPNCCKKKCVNVLRDRSNCGRCGKKCKFNEICCNGKCVNPSFNRRHCGGCNSSCGNGSLCAFGLCNYA